MQRVNQKPVTRVRDPIVGNNRVSGIKELEKTPDDNQLSPGVTQFQNSQIRRSPRLHTTNITTQMQQKHKYNTRSQAALMCTLVSTMDMVGVLGSPIYVIKFPPTVHLTQCVSFLFGLIVHTKFVYVIFSFFGIWFFEMNCIVFVPLILSCSLLSSPTPCASLPI